MRAARSLNRGDARDPKAHKVSLSPSLPTFIIHCCLPVDLKTLKKENVMRLAQLQTSLTSNAITTASIAEWHTRGVRTYQTQTLLTKNPHAQDVSDMAYK